MTSQLWNEDSSLKKILRAPTILLISSLFIPMYTYSLNKFYPHLQKKVQPGVIRDERTRTRIERNPYRANTYRANTYANEHEHACSFIPGPNFGLQRTVR